MIKKNPCYPHLFFSKIAIFCLVFSCTTPSSQPLSTTTQNTVNHNDKHKGVHVFGHLDSLRIQPLLNNNFEWISFVPYAYQDAYDSPEIIHHHGDSVEMLQRDSTWLSEITIAQEAGFKVFFKPHLWLGNIDSGKWRSDIYPKNDADWETWKKTYTAFILRYARIAEKADVELFCIGVELTRLTLERPEYWEQLIKEIRANYSGQITYAANWYEEYENIRFWNQLDYIGIQAYFPLSQEELPSIANISTGWQQHLPKMDTLSKKLNKPVLFTEMGYKSTSDAAIRPWEWLENTPENLKKLSHQTQANCYQAFFDTIWKKEWFAGVHIWQWRAEYTTRGGLNNLDFTPQRKPAELVIRKGFESLN